jgi:hypothetical protein
MLPRYTKTYRPIYVNVAACFISFIILVIGLPNAAAQSVTENTKDISVKKMLEVQSHSELDEQKKKHIVAQMMTLNEVNQGVQLRVICKQCGRVMFPEQPITLIIAIYQKKP